MKTIHFHKSLRQYTNNHECINVDVVTYYDLIKATMDLFKKFNDLIVRMGTHNNAELALVVDGKLLNIGNLMMPATGKEIKLVPIIKGSGRIGMIIAAIAIVALIIVTGQVELLPALTVISGATGSIGAAALAGGTVISLTTIGQLALGIAASLFLSALQPAPKPPRFETSTGGFRRDNDAFGSLTNTVDSSISVPLNYGEIRTAGHLLSGFVKTIDHGKEDIIEVSDQF